MRRRQPFEPTHRVQIGTGKNRTYVYVRIAGEAGMKHGQRYYNVVVSPVDKSGITSMPMMPASSLEELEQSEILEQVEECVSEFKKSVLAQKQRQQREIESVIIAEIGDDDITVAAASDGLFQAFMNLNNIPLHFQEWTMERRRRAMKYALKHAKPLKAVKRRQH